MNIELSISEAWHLVDIETSWEEAIDLIQILLKRGQINAPAASQLITTANQKFA